MKETLTSQSAKKDLDPVVRSLRRFSVIVADTAFKLHLRPNQITLFRFFVFGGAAAAFLFFGGYTNNVIALVFVALGFFFDLVDGDLARRHNMKSNYGAQLEANLDSILLSILILSIATNAVMSHSNLAFVGIIVFFSQIFSMHFSDLLKSKFDIDCVESNPRIEKLRKDNQVSFKNRFIIELMAPKNFAYSLFSNFRYYLVVGIFTNHLHQALLMYSVMLTLRWIILLLVTLKYAKSQDTPLEDPLYHSLSELDTSRNLRGNGGMA